MRPRESIKELVLSKFDESGTSNRGKSAARIVGYNATIRCK